MYALTVVVIGWWKLMMGRERIAQLVVGREFFWEWDLGLEVEIDS